MKNDKYANLKKSASLVAYASTRMKLENRGAEYWGCCPFHNEKTPSFAIKKKSTGEEVFYCQGCGKGGDIFRFVEMIDSCTPKVALDTVSTFANVSKVAAPVNAEPEWNEQYAKVTSTFQNPVEETAKKDYPISDWAKFEQALQTNPAALLWLENIRGITKETAELLHLGYAQSCKGAIKEEDEEARHKGWILFPRIAGGKLIAVKMRSIFLKTFSQWAGMDPKALFNVETICPFDPVFVTEGELDTAIFEQAGLRAVSIPSASSIKLTPSSKNALKQATEIFLAGDNDGKVGNIAMAKLARELGKGAYIILWPGVKDANAFFLKACNRNIEKFSDEVAKLMVVARATPVQGFTRMAEQYEEGTDIDMSNDPDRLHFPWREVDEMHYTPAGYVSIIYSTYTGTGKTVFTTQVAIHEAKRGEVVVVYSPEIKRDPYKALIAAQVLGEALMKDGGPGLNRAEKITVAQQQATKKLFDQTYEEEEKTLGPYPDWYHVKHGLEDSKLAYYAGYEIPYTDTEEIIDFIEYAVRTIGATRFVIDTLQRIIQAPEGENQSQTEGRAIKRLEKIAADQGCIFIVIGQSNKEGEDLKEVRRDSYGVLRGSREYQDVAQSIYLLHRKKVERPAPGAVSADDLLEQEAELVLRKIRLQGKGKPLVRLVYLKKCSKFGILKLGAAPSPAKQEPVYGDEETPFDAPN